MRKGSVLFLLLFINLNLSYSQENALDFTLVDTKGKEWNLYNELGKRKTVILDFFYADCKPCQKWAPAIDSMFFDYGSNTENVIVLGISDRDDNPTIDTFKKNYDANYPAGGTEGGGFEITDLYQSYFTFLGWPLYAVVCQDTGMTWDIGSLTPGVPEIRDVIDSCLNLPVGIFNQKFEIEKFKISGIYPVPTKGNINIKIDTKVTEKLQIEIFDIYGQYLKSLYKEELSNSSIINLSLEGLQNGLYYLRISNSKGSFYNIKIVLLK